MRKLVIILLLIGVVPLASADVIPGVSSQLAPANTQTVVWQKTPIAFSVPVGNERLISFPTYLTLNNASAALTRQRVSIINNNGTLYIRAHQAFAPVRLYVTLHTGQVVLVDVAGVKSGDTTPVQVVLPHTSKGLSSAQRPRKTVSYVTLMRYAIAHLYAPMRLVTDNANIRRAPMYTSKSVRLLAGEPVIALPQISWRSNGIFVTAVIVKNTSHHRLHLSPLRLLGNWKAVSFYPLSTLNPSGNATDRTTVFLLSNAPFNTALHANKEVV